MANENDISFRHLPDLSSSSFSFEIPPESNDELLLNDDDDFFGVGNDSFATPAPARAIHEPLTVKLITSKPVFSAQREFPETLKPEPTLSILSSSSQLNSTLSRAEIEEDVEQTRAKRVIALKTKGSSGVGMRNEILSTPQRMQKLRDEIKGLADPKHRLEPSIGSSSDSIEKSMVPVGHTHGQIIGTHQFGCQKTVRSSENSMVQNAIAPSLPLVQRRLEPSQAAGVPGGNSLAGASECEDIDMSVTSTARGGLAERLVMYSQNLVGVSNLPGHAGTFSSVLTDSLHSQEQVYQPPTDDEGPNASVKDTVPCLTLSQLSPLNTKHRSSTPDLKIFHPPSSAASPMRESHKRQGSPVLDTQLRKKEKLSAVNPSSRAILPGSRTLNKKRALSVNSSSASGMAKTKPVRHVSGPSRTTRRSPVISKRSAGGSSIAQGHILAHSSGSYKDSGDTSQLSLEQSGSSTKITTTSRRTRPVEFRSHSSVRSEARKDDTHALEHEPSSRPKLKLHTPYAIPDFKSSHSAQGALLASLKEQIKPVVPIAIEMHTDIRARERNKFNERVREKEAEIDRALEERKRQQAEEEERENRKLRKKAIPKAHPVPDWYKDAPRRRDRSQSGNEGNS